MCTFEQCFFVVLGEFVDQPSLQEFRTVWFDLQIIVVDGYSGIELHFVEVSEEVNITSFLAIARSGNNFLVLCSFERCSHSKIS